MKNECFEKFTASMTEIFSTMVGIDLVRTDTFENIMPDSKIIIGAMVLRGDINHLMTIETDFHSAGIIISNMTGIFPEELSADDLADGIQEIVNMVAGATKTKLESTGCSFRLTSTFAFKGKDAGFFIKNGIDTLSASFCADDAVLSLNMYDM